MQNQTISELYTDDKKAKYSNDPYVFKSVKNFYEKLYNKKQLPTLSLLKFLAIFLTERKSQMDKFTFVIISLSKTLETLFQMNYILSF